MQTVEPAPGPVLVRARGVPRQRLRSLDVARGLVVALSTGLSIVTPAHAGWYGLEVLDLLFPAFLTLMGAALAVAFRGRLRAVRLVRRTAVLLVLGVAFNALEAGSTELATLRLPGVLQRFALVGLAVVLVLRVGPSWLVPAGAGVVLLGGYQALLLFTSAGCESGLPQQPCNLPGAVDVAVFGRAHVYRGGEFGHDPEGLVSTLGALATALLGATAGRLLLTRPPGRGCPVLLGLAAASGTAAVGLAATLPVAKRLWTPAFAATSAVPAILLWAAAVVVADRLGARRDSVGRVVRAALWLPEAFGRNSLLVYFGRYVLGAALAGWTLAGGGSALDGLREQLVRLPVGPVAGEALVSFAFWALVAGMLHWRRWYLRA